MQYEFFGGDPYEVAKMKQEALLRDAEPFHADAVDESEARRARFMRQYRIRSLAHRYLPGLAVRMDV